MLHYIECTQTFLLDHKQNQEVLGVLNLLVTETALTYELLCGWLCGRDGCPRSQTFVHFHVWPQEAAVHT